MKILLLLLLESSSALADDGAIAQCRTLKDGAPRLACYDAIVLGAPGARGAAPSRQVMEKTFGFDEKRVGLDAIESTIPGKFDGWEPNQLITLTNGQVWRVVDDSKGVVYGTDLKVKVERSSFGATMMVIAGSNKAPRVKRVR